MDSTPGEAAYRDSSGGGTNVQVTRNVPPKRVTVNDGNTVSWDDKTFTAGDSLVLPGPMADQLAFAGHVEVSDHDAAADWNRGTAKAEKYAHADGKDASPVDVTANRQKLGQEGEAP